MGLDVYLYRLMDVDVDKIIAYNVRSRNYWLRSCYYWFRDKNKSILADGEKRNSQIIEWEWRVARSLGLPDDVESYIAQHSEEIELPSTKYAGYSIGYFRSGYGGGGINTILRTTIKSDLYYAFPEAKPSGGYIRPNWHRTQKRLLKILDRFQSIGADNVKFRSAIAMNIEIGRNFRDWLKPSSQESRERLAKFEEWLEPEKQFRNYVEELSAVIETVEYVLSQPEPGQYILYWSA